MSPSSYAALFAALLSAAVHGAPTSGRSGPAAAAGISGAGAAAMSAPIRLNALVLDSLSLAGASNLPVPSLALPSDGPVATPEAFRQLAVQQSALRVNAVVERLAKTEQAEASAPEAVRPTAVSLGAPGSPHAPNPVGAPADPSALAALDRKTGVDIQELSDAVQSVMSGFTPAQIATMDDEEFAAGAERILAALQSRANSGRGSLSAPEPGFPTPERVSAFLKEFAPAIQSAANLQFDMDLSNPKSWEACGPVSLGVRGPLKRALRRKFPDANMDVVLEAGRLDGHGDPVLHVFLKIVSRRSDFLFTPLAIADFTASQKPENVTALGLKPGEPVILPWETDLYEKRYPVSLPAGRDRAALIERVEKARGPQADALERRLGSVLN